ncbi:hypothetical protein LTR56_023309 [Elasticomyces elasticus]|nr:hypothetical protein LTR56_023309 [Elasticomyces elasticus]KAK4908825.1 hypothetical protein LTR49_022329 [Elasticomyces elasticus]KAK5743900.1 hypothetical protein LTS12_023664 [Elasticomyces elasticus]
MAARPYNPLGTSQKEIRVLNLLPGIYNSPLQCHIWIISLATQPPTPYEALSYTWGDSWTGKSGLRSRLKRRTLWIDALCIEQANAVERASQVSLMGTIYSSAERVNVWLGMSSLQAGGMLPQLSESIKWTAENLAKSNLRTRTGCSDLLGELKWNLAMASKGVVARMDEALKSTDPCWLDRAWVVQEFVLARSVYICFDHTSLKFEPYNSTHPTQVQHMAERYPHFYRFQTVLDRFTGLFGRHQDSQGEARVRLLDVARLTSSFEASNPHDKIYSLLGLIHPEEAVHIPPDYTAPSWVTFARASYAATIGYCNLSILEFASWTNESHQPLSLPSWAVDFTHMQRSHVYIALKTDFQWRAAGSGYNPPVTLSTDLRCVTAKGLYFATIDVSLPMFAQSSNGSYLAISDPALLPAQVDRMIEQAKGRVATVGWRTTLGHLLRVNERQPEEDLFFALSRRLGSQASRRTEPQAIRDILAMCFRHWKACVSLRHPYAAEALGWSEEEVQTDSLLMWEGLMESSETVCMFLTYNGFLGFAPGNASHGDSIVFLRGARWPVVLRQYEDCWEFRGLAYVAGIMNGELVDVLKDMHLTEKEFVLC